MALRCAIFNLEDAYKNFFAKRGNYPVFKAKRSYQSYKTNCIVSSYKNNIYSNIKIDLEKRQIKLPKLGLVAIRGYCNKKGMSKNKSLAKYILDASLKDLSIREYKCQNCGRELDRDINASINILFEGLKLHYNQANLF